MTDVKTVPGSAAHSPLPDRGVTIERRRRLPGGRAVVGAFLVTAAAVGIFAIYLDAAAGPSTDYVVAARSVAVGSQLRLDDLALVPLDLPPEQRSRAFDDRAALEGATLIGPVEADELIQSSMVVATQPGQVEEISFAIDLDRAVAGRLLPGERVDLLATYGTGDRASTVAVVRDALVVGVDRESSSTLSGPGKGVVSLAVADPVDSLAIAHAVNAGSVTLVRTSGLDRPADLPDRYRPDEPTGTPSTGPAPDAEAP